MSTLRSAIPLAEASSLAAVILDQISGFCDRIQIAGSIRRQRPLVNDIDIVLLPKSTADAKALRARCKARCTVHADAPQILIVETPGHIQLDIWLASAPTQDLAGQTPGNWGSLLLCRTGSRQHNIYIAQIAQQKGYHWNPYKGILSGRRLLASETEEDIFCSLGLPNIAPVAREIPAGHKLPTEDQSW